MTDWFGGPIDITDDLEKFSDERAVVAFERAEREFGGCVADYESDEFVEEFATQLRLMVAGDNLRSLVNKGVIEANVNEDGELSYTLTDKGREAFEND